MFHCRHEPDPGHLGHLAVLVSEQSGARDDPRLDGELVPVQLFIGVNRNVEGKPVPAEFGNSSERLLLGDRIFDARSNVYRTVLTGMPVPVMMCCT